VIRRFLCVILTFSLALAAGSAPALAQTPQTPAAPQSPPARQPGFRFQGVAPDRQERESYAARQHQDASRASQKKAGDRDETAFIVVLVIFSAAFVAGGIFLLSQGI
jgi:hypothetical protein